MRDSRRTFIGWLIMLLCVPIKLFQDNRPVLTVSQVSPKIISINSTDTNTIAKFMWEYCEGVQDDKSDSLVLFTDSDEAIALICCNMSTLIDRVQQAKKELVSIIKVDYQPYTQI